MQDVLKIKLLGPNANVPVRSTAGAAGYDMYSSVTCVVPANGKALVATDVAMAIPENCYGQLAPRSGLASKHSIHVGAGVIDSDYRGPVSVLLFNLSTEPFKVNVGDRIAQLIIKRISLPDAVVVEDLDETVRGESGFGSTGGFGSSIASEMEKMGPIA